MSKISTFVNLIKAGKIRKIFNIIRKYTRRFSYLLRARIEDFRIGGMSLESLIPSKYADSGAHPTQSTDYRLLDSMFESYQLNKTATLVDVGSGEGRVLTYLHLRKHTGKLIGIELDADVTETAKKRTAKCKNIELHCANVFDCAELIKSADVLFMSNPFGEKLVKQFVEMLEKERTRDLVIYYAYDLHNRKLLDKRDNWTILRRGVIHRPESHPARYSIYKYSAPKQ